ncbi:MAG TPA: extensin family protein [Xanthobacteraceae bacterium]|nr:extensin family protein [Xanthobacteraceae bacterium]
MIRGHIRRRSPQLVVAALAAACLAGTAQAKDPVPLPPLRPSIPADSPIIPLPRPRPALPLPGEAAAEPAGPTECQLRMTADIAVIEPLPPVSAPHGCGIDDPVRLSAVTSKDKVRIAITPPAILRCTTAEALAIWIRDDVAPIAATLGAPLGGVANFDSYECRGRNRIVGAKISEHGKGNAIDIKSVTLANGKSYELTDIAVAKQMRERLKASACARFTTVLGPASDGFHENHVHVDLAERRSGYRICQWAVRDASDLIPLPRERPEEAPPRDP